MAVKIKQQNAGEGEIKVDDRLKHIAFIMDGNGRWAQKRGKPREFGHRQGAEVFKTISRYCGKIGIKYITVYAFSTENWKRSDDEVKGIMKLLEKYLDEVLTEFSKYDIKVRFIGDLTVFGDKIKSKIRKVEELTANKSLLLNIAFNYGARSEIVNAVNRFIADGKGVLDEKLLSSYLYTHDCPDPDLIVRTGGELRLSNFLLWQSAYSELYFTDCLWPDMTPDEVDKAVKEFYSRKRRYGGV